MKLGKLLKRMTAGVFSVLMLITLVFSGTVFASETETMTTLTFSDSGITETVAGSGYSISGTTLSITAAGTYLVTGSCSEGSIEVAKELTDVVLILDDLSLTSAVTAPIVVKKSSSVTIHLEGESTLTDNEDATTEDTNEDFEGAAIKVKTGSSVTFCGEGTLNVAGTAKNGIKGGTEAALTFNGGTYNVTAANNGIASDGTLVMNAGTYVITAENDGIKAVPDSDDTTSAGTLTINGGTYTLNVNGDGIQAEQDLTINNGIFSITTFGGYNTSGFDEDTMSCKGIKASGDREDVENSLTITGGSFDLNTRDDAVHSDGSVTITGGTLAIQTGDDGVHAETALTLGTANGYERDPEITITASYEGLEGGNVYIYSGRHYVTASDDGINAAGGSSNGTDAGQGGDQFRPGGGPGGFGQQITTTGSSDYNIYIYGGDVYVDCLGDGLDSNGGLYLTGGDITVFSMQSGGDNSPIDADGTVSINGATLCAAGSAGMMMLNASSFGQKYYQANNVSKSAGTVIDIYHNNSLVYSDKLPRTINYLLYTSPDMTSNSCTVKTASSVTACSSNAWAHNWDSGSVVTTATDSTAGLMKYTCSDCGDTEYKTIACTGSYNCSGHEGSSSGSETTDETDEGYTVSFTADSGVKSINVYYTQDYTAASESGVTSTVSRDSDTGEADSTGSGQVNFTVELEDGYTLSADQISITGTYKNLKDVSEDAGIDNTYRVTKIASDLTVSITTTASSSSCEHEEGTPVEENRVEATCEEAGSYDEVVYCTVCGEELSRETITIPAIGHSFSEWTVTKEATETEEGTKTRTCTVCGKTETETIPKKEQSEKNGWYLIDGLWYYYKADQVQTGWLLDNGYWYYLEPETGIMQTGWVYTDDNWYFLYNSGAMAKGWLYVNDNWYYLYNSGAMATGWVKVNGYWYFLYNSGAMAKNEWVGSYWLNANGSWTYQPQGFWKHNNAGWWFGDTSGWYAKNGTVRINGVDYRFNAAGYWIQ